MKLQFADQLSLTKIIPMRWNTFRIFLLLFLLTLAFYWHILFTTTYAFPWDILSYYYPSLHFVHEQLRHGSFPLWDPYILAGFPTIADPQSGALYPLNFVMFLVQLGSPLKYKAVESLLIFHYFLAGSFMYVFARSFGITQFGSLLSAVAYMFSGYLVSHAQHMATVHSAAWIPLILYFARLSLLRKRLRYVILTGLSLGVQSLIGYVQMSAYTLLSVILLYLWQMGLTFAATKKLGSLRVYVGYLSLLLIVLSGVAAILMFPTYELGNLSIRRLVDYDEATAGMSPINLINLLVPNFFGGLNDKPMWIERDFTETHLYVGILSLVLVFFSPRYFKKLPPLDYFWLISPVLFIMLSFGQPIVLVDAFFYLLPGFNQLHRLVNYFSIANVSICLLVGFGMTALASDSPSDAENKSKFLNRLIQVAILVAFVILTAFYLLLSAPENLHARISHNVVELILLLVFLIASAGALALFARQLLPDMVCKTLILLLLVADVFTYSHAQPFNAARLNPNTALTPSSMDGSSAFLDFLRRDNPNRFRIAVTCGYENAPNVLKIRSINGINPIMLRSYSEFISQFFPYSGTAAWIAGTYNFSSPLIDLLGVQYMITCDTFHDATKLELPADKYELVYHDWYRIYRNKRNPLQLGFFPQALSVSDDGAVLSLLNDRSFFDPDRILLLPNVPSDNSSLANLTVKPVCLRIEAENYVDQSPGIVESARSASGGKYLAIRGKRKGHLAAYSLDLPRELEQCTFGLRYCSAEGLNTSVTLNITNGPVSKCASLILSPTKDWKSGWRIATVKLDQLKKGHNAITIGTSGEADMNIDSVYIVEHTPPRFGDHKSDLRIIDYKPTEILIDAVTDRQGFLFLNEMYYPGWQAFVDGKETPILKANSIFRAIYLRAGNHKVEFRFRPVSFYIGATITLVTVLALVVYFLRHRLIFKKGRRS